MGKEEIQVTIAPEKNPKLITVEAPGFDGSPSSLENLEEKIRQLKELHSDVLFLVRTPQITGRQLEVLFTAGAMAHRTLSPEEEEEIPKE